MVYSFTAVDQLTPCLTSFKKDIRLSRQSTTGPMPRGCSTNSRPRHARVRPADVIDISAGETHTLLQMGLIDPYLSPSRDGIPKDFMDEKGYWTAHIIS